MAVVLLIVAAAVAVIILAVRSRFWPYGPCPSCQGRRGRGAGSTASAYNRCGRCDGGERIRPLALVWPQHRAEARKRKQRRNKR